VPLPGGAVTFDEVRLEKVTNSKIGSFACCTGVFGVGEALRRGLFLLLPWGAFIRGIELTDLVAHAAAPLSEKGHHFWLS
jgi:hypothetical protein